MTENTLPVLYSFRRCPYAMRARLALANSGLKTQLREVVLKDKPPALLSLSAKATVPVLQTTDGKVIDESLDIMLWALQQHDPDGWYQQLDQNQQQQLQELIDSNDGQFKYYLDRYKYADRYPEHSEQYYREQGEQFLLQLESLLEQNGCLLKASWSMADMALLPFIRQFAFVDKAWFDQSPYPHLKQWLEHFLQSELFQRIMFKYPQWREGDEITLFP